MARERGNVWKRMPGFIGESALKTQKVDRGPFKCQTVYCLAAEKNLFIPWIPDLTFTTECGRGENPILLPSFRLTNIKCPLYPYLGITFLVVIYCPEGFLVSQL
jgi:hypothetical protein